MNDEFEGIFEKRDEFEENNNEDHKINKKKVIEKLEKSIVQK